MEHPEEKRKHARVPSNFSIKYRDLNKPETEYKGTLSKNISAGGVRFKCDKFISLACRLVVEIDIPSLQRSIRAVSKIAWIKKLPAGDDYEVGNQFLEISREDKDALQEFVKENSEPSLI